GGHVFYDLHMGGLDREIRHHQTDCGRRAAKKTEGLSYRDAECHMERLIRACGERELKMARLADIQLSGIPVRELQREFYRAAHIGDRISAEDDKVSMSSPALCIARQHDREHFC